MAEVMPESDFWSANQPGFRFSSAAVGSRDFFEEVTQHRYGLEPHILDVVRFDEFAGQDVLEAGCGIATDGLQFARAGARYTGLDFSPAALALARQRFEMYGAEGRFVEASVTDLPFENESFDAVYSHGVIHHVHETEKAVAEFHRVLRPGGVALVMLYHRASLNYYFNIMFVRRALALTLLMPGGTTFAARVSGESKDLLAAHRQLLREHGARYLIDRDLFLSHNTDGPGNELSKAFTREEGRALFASFDHVETTIRFLNLRVWPYGGRLARTRIARRLEPKIGWHLYVRAMKGAQDA